MSGSDRRLLTTLVLIFFVLAGWSYIYPMLFPRSTTPPPASPGNESGPGARPAVPALDWANLPPLNPSIRIQSSRYSARLSNSGATIQELTLNFQGERIPLLSARDQPVVHLAGLLERIAASPQTAAAPAAELLQAIGTFPMPDPPPFDLEPARKELAAAAWEISRAVERGDAAAVRARLPSARAAVAALSAAFPGHFLTHARETWNVEEVRASSARFTTRVGSVRFEKTISLSEDGSHSILVHLSLRNEGSQLQDLGRLEFQLLQGVPYESTYNPAAYQWGFWGGEKGDIVWYQPSGIVPAPRGESTPSFAGIKNRYFAVAAVPDDRLWVGDWSATSLPYPREDQPPLPNLRLGLTTVPIRVVPGQTYRPMILRVYGGPVRNKELLEMKQVPLVGLLDYNGFNFVGAVIDWLLELFGGLTGSYGIGILLTTLAIRGILLFASVKGQVSMYRMQELKPQIELLQEKYKDDREKFGREQMRLLRENRINPAWGCLATLIQFPVFIGMYGVVDISVNLRQAPFLWFSDLSQPDRLIPFGHPLPLLGWSSLNLLPIVMTVTWVLQGYFAPRSPDPNMALQQKILMFLPVLFGYWSYELAAGLSWYFLINSLLAMVEQTAVKKWLLKPGKP